MSIWLLHSLVSKRIGAVLAGVACLLILIGGLRAIAHAPGQSYLYFQIGQDTLNIRAEVTAQDLNDVLNLGLPAGKKKLRNSLVEPHLEQIKSYVESHIAIADGRQPNAQPYTLVYQGHDYLNPNFAKFVLLDYAIADLQELPDSVQVTYDVLLAEKPQHTNLVLIEQNWKTGTFGNEANASLIINEPGQTQSLDVASGSFWQGAVGVIWLGIQHILSGVDHLFFLAALLLPAVLWRKASIWQPIEKLGVPLRYALKVVAVFTVAQTLTMGLATLAGMGIPARFVESVTAAAIGLAAIEIFYPVLQQGMWVVIAAFGLCHGFGIVDELARKGALSQFPIPSLLSFNLGVAVSQIGIAAGMVLLLYLVRTQRFYPRYVLPTGGALLGAMSLYWFIEHAFNINIRVLPWIQGLLGVIVTAGTI